MKCGNHDDVSSHKKMDSVDGGRFRSCRLYQSCGQQNLCSPTGGGGGGGGGKVELSVDNNAHYCDLIVSEALPYFECKKTT